MKKETSNDWNIVVTYTRAEALADGVQVEADPETRKIAGLKFPVYLTRTVYDRYVKVPKGCDGIQNEKGRLLDIFTMFKYYISRAHDDSRFMQFKVSVYMPDKGEGFLKWAPNEKRDGSPTQRLVTLHATIGPVDANDPRPAITIMCPGED